jgi:hypothetical protein
MYDRLCVTKLRVTELRVSDGDRCPQAGQDQVDIKVIGTALSKVEVGKAGQNADTGCVDPVGDGINSLFDAAVIWINSALAPTQERQSTPGDSFRVSSA